MSHNVAIKGVAVKSIPALETAVRQLAKQGIPISMRESKRFRTYPGQNDECDYAITLDGVQMEIGVKADPAKPGEYQFLFDPYTNYSFGAKHQNTIRGWLQADHGGGKAAEIRPDMMNASHDKHNAEQCIGKLTQMYSICAAQETLEGQGFSCDLSHNTATGEMVLVGSPTI